MSIIIKEIGKEIINGEEREFEIRVMPDGREYRVYTDVLKRLRAEKEKEWQQLKKALGCK